MYEYYRRFTSLEHMLNSKELATILKVKSLSGKIHSLFVSTYLNSLITEEEKIFYNTKKGLMQVFPYSLYNIFLEEFTNYEKNCAHSFIINNKTYKFIIEE